MTDEAMSDQDWSTYWHYADEASVTVRVVTSPDDPEPIEQWFIVSGGAAWDVEWLARQAQSIPRSGLAQDKSRSTDHYIDVHERRREWGAASAVIEIVLGIAVWAATSAAWDATKAVARQMSEFMQAGSTVMPQPLDEREAVGRAIWLVEEKYGESTGSVHLDSVQLTGGIQSIVRLRSSSGWSYELDLEIQEHLVTLARVKRSRS